MELSGIDSEVEGPKKSFEKARSKTSQRLKYEAEIAVLRRDLGGLEEIRLKLGLSRRKICQILMVDPSAWTRWTTEGSDAPPHVYQALKWYMDSKSQQVTRLESGLDSQKAQFLRLQQEIKGLVDKTQRLQRWVLVLAWVGGGLGILALIFGSLALRKFVN